MLLLDVLICLHVGFVLCSGEAALAGCLLILSSNWCIRCLCWVEILFETQVEDT